MPSEPVLPLQQARNLMLASLGLLHPPRKEATKTAVLSTIRQIHALQMDTISVVARAHLHILWSRLGTYDLKWLDELHNEGKLFEYFAHGVCLLPIEDYPLYRGLMKHKYMGWKNIREWGEKNQALLEQVLAHIQQNGGVRSNEFKGKSKRGGWWDWKAEKIALEHLYYRGDLMIAKREGFQRVYELRERILPDWDDSKTPAYEEVSRQLALKAVKALGVAREDWIAAYFYLPPREIAALLPDLEKEGLLPVRIEGMTEKRAWVHPDNADLLTKALNGGLRATYTSILSPFDPLVTDRARAKALFGLDFHIESYLPAANRTYGYFVLPILYKGRLVGRMDAKAWRKEKHLQVIKFFLQPDQQNNHELVTALAETLKRYAAWQGLKSIQVDWSEPAELGEKLNQTLKELM